MKIKQLALALGLIYSNLGSANTYVVALPNDLPANFDKAKLSSSLESFVLSTLKQGDELSLINGQNFSEISKFVVPDQEGADNIAVKRKLFTVDILKLRDYVGKISVSNDPVKFSLIQFPQLLKHVFGLKYDVNHRENPINILTIGNVLYYDKEGIFDMKNARFPSDGHILSDEQHSVYGTSNKQGLLKNVLVHQIFTNVWDGDNYKTRINRFWSLYIKNQGGNLATFTNDLQTGFERLTQNPSSVENFDFDNTKSKLEMYRATREAIPVGGYSKEAYFLADGVQISNEPPSSTQGNLRVGIRWGCQCDVDLYAKSNTAPDYLYYGRQDSTEGHYFKDFTSSTAVNGLEYIQFNDVDASNMEVKINLYSGSSDDGVVTGIVRAELNGKVYEAPFEIKPSFLSSDSKWTRINLNQLLKLA